MGDDGICNTVYSSYRHLVMVIILLIPLLFQFQSYMDSEIRAIMAQYMPLDSQNEVPNHVGDDRA